MFGDFVSYAFVGGRDEAPRLLDRATIEAFCEKWNDQGAYEALPDDDLHFWAAVHGLRSSLRTIPLEARLDSQQWLREHGVLYPFVR